MPHFVTIGYGDREGYDRTPEPLRQAAHAQDAELQRQGALIGVAGKPVQVRNPEAQGVETTDGPYLSSQLPIAGFAIIEAADLAEAIEKVSKAPCAICRGVIEVWPLTTP
ncbi:YciI family protein [Caulobacter sp. 1776]|uniref:YciI family protein n=1 Tax=Caulobacter sp. 1776 TaxID=3156420 RepID=UPI00339896F4